MLDRAQRRAAGARNLAADRISKPSAPGCGSGPLRPRGLGRDPVVRRLTPESLESDLPAASPGTSVTSGTLAEPPPPSRRVTRREPPAGGEALVRRGAHGARPPRGGQGSWAPPAEFAPPVSEGTREHIRYFGRAAARALGTAPRTWMVRRSASWTGTAGASCAALRRRAPEARDAPGRRRRLAQPEIYRGRARVRVGGGGAPRPDVGMQLDRVEWFGHVVVGAGFITTAIPA